MFLSPISKPGRTVDLVFLLNILGALVAVNIYLLARQGTGKLWPAMLTWVAFSFTVPLMPYSFLIFPELPAALLVIYACVMLDEVGISDTCNLVYLPVARNF